MKTTYPLLASNSLWSWETLEISPFCFHFPMLGLKAGAAVLVFYFGSSGLGYVVLQSGGIQPRMAWNLLCSSGVLKLGINLSLPPKLESTGVNLYTQESTLIIHALHSDMIALSCPAVWGKYIILVDQTGKYNPGLEDQCQRPQCFPL